MSNLSSLLGLQTNVYFSILCYSTQSQTYVTECGKTNHALQPVGNNSTTVNYQLWHSHSIKQEVAQCQSHTGLQHVITALLMEASTPITAICHSQWLQICIWHFSFLRCRSWTTFPSKNGSRKSRTTSDAVNK